MQFQPLSVTLCLCTDDSVCASCRQNTQDVIYQLNQEYVQMCLELETEKSDPSGGVSG